jgi:hypothetical protein
MAGARQGLVYGLHAICTFAGGAGGGAFLRGRGFNVAVFVRNGAGDYTLTLTDAIDTTGAQHGFSATGSDGAVSQIDVAILTATTIRVKTGAGAQVLTDMTFTLLVHDLGLV